jgi:CubicO group peptidase (beta-lactamase class C family)
MRFLLIAAFLTTGCASTHPELHALLKSYESQGFSGTVLVAKNGHIVLHEGYGFADRERGVRNGRETLYEVASLNKTYTAAAILQLESRGALATSDPLSKHLGAVPPLKDAATIHHLATHTAGLVPDGSDLGDGMDRDRFIANVKSVPAESVPGERYRYTNAGYSVLAAIVERVSGMPYESYVRKHLTSGEIYFRGETPARPMARGYIGEKESVPPPYRWGTRGAGGMITTVGELYRWHRQLHADPAMKKMWEPGPEEGYAWHVERDDQGRRMIHKGGGMREYASQIIEYPDEGVVIIWASNDLGKRWRQDLNRGIAKVMLRW